MILEGLSSLNNPQSTEHTQSHKPEPKPPTLSHRATKPEPPNLSPELISASHSCCPTGTTRVVPALAAPRTFAFPSHPNQPGFQCIFGSLFIPGLSRPAQTRILPYPRLDHLHTSSSQHFTAAPGRWRAQTKTSKYWENYSRKS